jgi:hypothetical protein
VAFCSSPEQTLSGENIADTTVLIMAVTLAGALRARAATITYIPGQSAISLFVGSSLPIVQQPAGANPWNADLGSGSLSAHQDYLLSPTGFVANGNATGVVSFSGQSYFDMYFSIDLPAVLHLATLDETAGFVQFFDNGSTLLNTTVPSALDASLVPGHVYEFKAIAVGGGQFSVNGELVPEPTTIALIAVAVCCIALVKPPRPRSAARRGRTCAELLNP